MSGKTCIGQSTDNVPADLAALRGKVEAAVASKDFDRALLLCDAYIQVHPSDGDARGVRGWVLHHRGDMDGAVIEYSACVDNNPDNLRAHLYRAQIFEYQGDLAKALVDYRKALRIEPSEEVAWTGLVAISYHWHDFHRMSTIAQEWLKAVPTASKPWVYLAMANETLGRLTEARAAVMRLLECDNADPVDVKDGQNALARLASYNERARFRPGRGRRIVNVIRSLLLAPLHFILGWFVLAIVSLFGYRGTANGLAVYYLGPEQTDEGRIIGEVERALQRIRNSGPGRWARILRVCRRIVVGPFPFSRNLATKAIVMPRHAVRGSTLQTALYLVRQATAMELLRRRMPLDPAACTVVEREVARFSSKQGATADSLNQKSPRPP